jgi:hypothetical protein
VRLGAWNGRIAARQCLAETGTAGLQCTTSISRRSFMEIANARRRSKVGVAQPAAGTAGFDPLRTFGSTQGRLVTAVVRDAKPLDTLHHDHPERRSYRSVRRVHEQLPWNITDFRHRLDQQEAAKRTLARLRAISTVLVVSETERAALDKATKPGVRLCGIVRDEAPYLLEWLAWYKLLNVDQIVIYDNESQDESTSILPILHRAGEIIHRPWPNRVGEEPQLPAYRDAARQCSTEWIAYLDVDEFLVLHHDSSVVAFLGRIPENCSAIAFNQRFFGSSELVHYDDRLVIERFVRTAAPDHFLNVWIKTMARARKIGALNNPHGCQLTSGYYGDPAGLPCAVRNECQTERISLTVGQYNHYILKSREEYLQKRAKGRVDTPSDVPEKYGKYTDEFFALHDENCWEDLSAFRLVDRVRTERDRLHQLCRG